MPAPTVQVGVVTTTDHNALAAYVDDTRAGILARGKRTTASSTTTGEVGVLRLDDIPIKGGHLYRIWTSGLVLLSTVNNDVVRASIRYTTDGSTPTTSSSVLSSIQERVDNITFPPTLPLLTLYVPTSDETLSILLTVSRATGTGNVSIAAQAGFDCDLVVEECGIDTGDVGVDI